MTFPRSLFLVALLIVSCEGETPSTDGSVDDGSVDDGSVDDGGSADASDSGSPVDASLPTCDPLAAAACASGERCGGFFPAADSGTEPSASIHVCAPNGTIPIGGTCGLQAIDGGAVDNCTAGGICMPTPGGDSTCFAICDPAASACPSGQPLCQRPFAAGPVGICVQCSGQYVTQEKTDQTRMYYDFSHGQEGAPFETGGATPVVAMEQIATMVRGRGIQLSNITDQIRSVCLSDADLLFISTPKTLFSAAEKTAIIDYVNSGGRLLFSMDDDVHSDLVGSQSNDILTPFSMSFGGLCSGVGRCDQGAITTSGNAITGATAIPITYIFGRSTSGGTSFINVNTAGGSSGAYTEVAGGGRLVIVSENTTFIDAFIDDGASNNRGFINAVLDWLLE